MAHHVRDSEGRLREYGDILESFQGNDSSGAVEHKAWVPTPDGLHSIDEHHLKSAEEATTHEAEG